MNLESRIRLKVYFVTVASENLLYFLKSYITKTFIDLQNQNISTQNFYTVNFLNGLNQSLLLGT